MPFSPNRRRKPGPKGPSVELIHAVVEMKHRNPNWGCPRIAQQIALALDRDNIERLSGNPLFFATPYGRGQWLSLRVDATFDWTVVEELVNACYRLVALKRMLVVLGARAWTLAELLFGNDQSRSVH
jgi:hypothetical protein